MISSTKIRKTARRLNEYHEKAQRHILFLSDLVLDLEYVFYKILFLDLEQLFWSNICFSLAIWISITKVKIKCPILMLLLKVKWNKLRDLLDPKPAKFFEWATVKNISHILCHDRECRSNVWEYTVWL